jgi:cold shock protein
MSDDLEVRRPDLLDLTRTGTVRWFKEEKGYGRITADDGEVLFVHFAHIETEGYRTLTEGQRVEFVWRGGLVAHGRHQAESVRPLD